MLPPLWLLIIIIIVILFFLIWFFSRNDKGSAFEFQGLNPIFNVDTSNNNVIQDIPEENININIPEEVHVEAIDITPEIEEIDITNLNIRLPVLSSDILGEIIRNRKMVHGNKVSQGEAVCCWTMEFLTGKPFCNCRPDFLENITGHNLELDCFNDELKVAVEYNGEQHYKFPHRFNPTYQKYVEQVNRDKYKMDKCDANGIYLIIVPYTVRLDKIPEFLTKKYSNYISLVVANQ